MGRALKIRWAFDPYCEDDGTWQTALDALRIYKAENDATIVPTFVLGSAETDWVGNVWRNTGMDMQRAIAEEMSRKLAAIDAASLCATPEVITSDAYSRRTDARALAEKMQGYDLLVVNTHARTGVERTFLGSFAETLMHTIAEPMLFVTPNTTKITGFERVFLPTDFSEDSHKVFQAMLKESFGLTKELTIYSKIAHPATKLLSDASIALGGGPISLEQFFLDRRSECEATAKQWEAEAEKHNIKTDFLIDDDNTPLYQSIITRAEEAKAQIISMPSFASRLDTFLLGSTARQVVRHSSLPVMIWRP